MSFGVNVKNLYVKTIKPRHLNDSQKQELVALHQQQINLDAQTILDYLLPRDYLLFYYHKKSHHLVATIGVQIINFKKTAIIYFGNVVVDPSCAHEGCISHASAKYIFRLFLKYPFKRKYCSGLASSSGSLVYSLKHKPSWPNPDEETPEDITQLMIKALHEIGVDSYRVEQGNLIATNLANKITKEFHVKQKPPTAAESFFKRINPGAEQGEQVFFLNPFTLTNALDLAIHALHGHLIKSPRFYRRIKKYKQEKPFFCLIILGICIVKNKIW